jgi:hypothetical protein
VNEGIRSRNSRDKRVSQIINKEDHAMKEQKKNYMKRMLALLALLGFLSVTGTVLASDWGGIWITPELTARW